MTPERRQQVEALFQEAVARPLDERTTFIQAVCIADPQLKQEIESLLAVHNKAHGLELPADEGAAKAQTGEGVFPPGAIVERFKVLSVLGQGGMGVVYSAEDTKLQRKVAIKVLPKQFTKDRERVRRFAQEARAASSLNHPNIVTIYDISETDAGYFIVMELIEGRTLWRVAKEQLPLQTVIDWGLQVARALAAAHAAGVVHRDIKLENIMVRDDGYIKVLDFGLARLTHSSQTTDEGVPTETNPNVLVGTAAYMSPEQARSEPVSYPTDVFSLGIVLYELATHQHPFPADSIPGRLHTIVSTAPRRPSVLNSEIPPAVETLFLQMLEKKAHRRPTAVAVAEALARTSLVGSGTRRRRLTQIAAAVACLIALCAIGGWLYFRRIHGGSSKPPDHPEILFIRQFGTAADDAAYGLAVTGGTVFVAGQTHGALAGALSGKSDAFLRKYGVQGDLQWTRQFNTSPGSAADAQDVMVTGEGGAYVGGSGSPSYLRRFDLDGVEVWTLPLGGDMRPFDLAGFGGNIYIAGQACCYDAWIGRFDGSGAKRWLQRFGTAENDTASAAIVRDEAVFVVGHVTGALPGQASAGGVDAFLRTYDLNGNTVWTRQFGTSGRDVANGVGTDASGIYVVGSTSDAFPGQTAAGGRDIFVRKYNFDGSVLWTRQFGSPRHEDASAVEVEAGYVYVSGNTEGALPGQTSAGATDIFVIKYSPQGDVSWIKQLGSSGVDFGRRIKVRREGVTVAGETDGNLQGQTNQGGYDAFLLKLQVDASPEVRKPK